MPKFTHQFFGGLLVGMALATLAVESIAVNRIDATTAFADMNMDALFAALNDIETLKNICGRPCDHVQLTYIEQRPERQPGED